ncbi:MAG: PAS domain S-box protein, partial [Ignavibacteriae bacterium]
MTEQNDEIKRLQELHEYEILDTPSESDFDALTFIASQICIVPIALINLVDEERVWIKSKVGVQGLEMPRAQSFCAEAIKQKKLLMVEDTTLDSRFSSMPMVVGGPKYRFYAGQPLVSPRGHVLGTLCILDTVPRTLTERQQRALQELGHLAVSQLEIRHHLRRLESTVAAKEKIDLELRNSQMEYKHIIDTANEIIYRTDENGLITFFNPAATRLLQYEQDELIGSHYRKLIHPSFRSSVIKYYGGQFLKEESNTSREVPALTKDGRTVWLDQNVQLLFDQDRISGFSVVARDITEKKRIDERVADSERKLLAIVNTVNEGITLSDESGFFEVFNPRMTELTGYSLHEANDTPDFSRLIASSVDEFQRLLDRQKQLWSEGRVQESEISIRTKTGEKKILLLSSSLIDYNNRKMALSAYRDITEHRKAEQAFRDSARRFMIFFESNPLPTWVFDLESYQYLEVNNAAITHYGYSREEFLAMNIMNLRPPEETENLQSELEIIKTRDSSAAQSKHCLKDGTIIDVQLFW